MLVCCFAVTTGLGNPPISNLHAGQAGTADRVTVEEGTLSVPTYTFGRSQTLAPLFKESGSKGLYPYTSFDRDSLSTEPVPTEYHSLTLENEYLKVVLLPELGGRIWSAWDKANERELFYHPGAVKPTSYNQRGAWPAGNLEVYGPYDAHMLTWPGEPWAWAVEENPDGSASITLSHVEHFFRNKVSMRVTLHPGRSFIELTVKLYNPTSLPNRYLLWTNAGLPATDGTRFLYPMTQTIGHDSAEFGTWPVFRDEDLSWYRNNRSMLGVFGLDVYDNFMGAYDYDADQGTLCYTNRQIARGIKTWTWGVGQVGLRHIEQYSDTGIPYIEVQSGRFVWDGNYEFIDPGQSDGWTEYWFGVNRLGGVTTSSRDVALRLERDADSPSTASLKMTSTGVFPDATVKVSINGNPAGAFQLPLSPLQVAGQKIDLGGAPPDAQVRVVVESHEDTLLDRAIRLDGTPPPAELARDFIPREFGPSSDLSTEELFQKGLTSEKLGRLQEAQAVYREVLERDPKMVGANLQLGLEAWRTLDVERAADHFERALEREPFNGDALYFRAKLFMEAGNPEGARRLLYRLLPSSDKYPLRDFELGVLAIREGKFREAAPLLESASRTMPQHLSIRQAYAYTLRRLGQLSRARSECEAILSLDPTNAFAAAELAALSEWNRESSERLGHAVAGHAQGYVELAATYMALGAWEDAGRLLSSASESATSLNPMMGYYASFLALRTGDKELAGRLAREASGSQDMPEIFPFRREDVPVLRSALALNPDDAKAASLLGIILYHLSHREEAKTLWSETIQTHPSDFASLQHLGWALLDEGEAAQALELLGRASGVRPGDLETSLGVARLYSLAGDSEGALRAVEGALAENRGNDRLTEQKIKLTALLGNYDDALGLLNSHRFSVRHQSYSLLRLYQAVHLLKAYEAAAGSSHAEAVRLVRAASEPPESLGVDDFATLSSSRLLFFEALAHELAGNEALAFERWQEAAATVDADTDGEGLFRAIAIQKIGRSEETRTWFAEFEAVNRQRKTDSDLQVRLHAFYLSGIHNAYAGRPDAARTDLEEAQKLDGTDLFTRHAQLWLEAGFFR